MNRETLLGKLALKERRKRELINICDSALTLVIMKADAYVDTAELDTEIILSNANALHNSVQELREVINEINKLKRELGQ